VLEPGCGSGRYLEALARRGLDVLGIDSSPVMVELARRRLAKSSLPGEAVLDDMTDFDLGRAFALIVVPFRVFQFLLTPEAQRSCLAAFRRHLAPDGELVLRHIRRVSKPGRRVYRPSDKIPNVLDGLGVAVLSTSKGVISSLEAKKLKIGGEVLCEVW